MNCRAFLSWLWLPNVLLFSTCLSLFHIALPYRSQSSSSNNSLKLLLAIFISFFENLSCLAMLMLVLWPECVWDPRIFRISSSVQFSRSFVSDSLQPHTAASQASRFFSNCRACSNSCSLNWWCYPTISYSDIPFSSRLQSFPTTGTFPVSQFFTSVGQSIGVSASASVLPKNIQDWFPLGLTSGFPCSPRDSRVLSNTTVQKSQIFSTQLSL